MIVPDQQEAFVNDDGSISVIIEILEHQPVPDTQAAEWVDPFFLCSRQHHWGHCLQSARSMLLSRYAVRARLHVM